MPSPHTPGYVGNLHSAPSTDVHVEFDISQLVRLAMASNPKALTVVLVPRGLFDARGEPLPVPAEAQGTVGSVRIIGH